MAADKVHISGAGISGLAAACLLSDAGADVRIFERFVVPKPLGSGLVIQPVGQAVLAGIGCLQDAIEPGNPIWRMLGHEAGGQRKILDVRYGPTGGATFGLALHRAALFDVLWRAVRA